MSNERNNERPEDGGSGLSAEMLADMMADVGMGVSSESDELGEIDVDPLSGPVFGPTFLEKILMAVIKGNPIVDIQNSHHTASERQRLDAVMLALVGHKSSGHPFSDDPDDRALLWMKEEQVNRRRQGRKVSGRGLAIEAAKKFIPGFNKDRSMASADRLREKFSGVYYRKQGKGREPNVQGTLGYRVSCHDYLAESVEAQMLARVAAEFGHAGVRLILPG